MAHLKDRDESLSDVSIKIIKKGNVERRDGFRGDSFFLRGIFDKGRCVL